MSAPISPITAVLPASIPTRSPVIEGAAPGVFQAVLQESIGAVQNSQSVAQGAVDRFLAGEGEELHHVALVTQQAELSFELFMQVRNKVVQAYQDIMRMQM